MASSPAPLITDSGLDVRLARILVHSVSRRVGTQRAVDQRDDRSPCADHGTGCVQDGRHVLRLGADEQHILLAQACAIVRGGYLRLQALALAVQHDAVGLHLAQALASCQQAHAAAGAREQHRQGTADGAGACNADTQGGCGGKGVHRSLRCGGQSRLKKMFG
jgi:hypothetical protein